ncbi:MAG: hypothetical protein EDX89_19340 [Acidobacteria bacterium]|nr:MAG: hypothetical protein EDX89_19340 [Acidobacteriota bacterium]
MSPGTRRLRVLAGGAVLVAVALAGLGLFRLRQAVRRQTSPEGPSAARSALSFSAPGRLPAPAWVAGDGSVRAAGIAGGRLWLGGDGLRDEETALSLEHGLPTLRLAAVGALGDAPVFALEAGGWGRVGASGVEIASTGFGALHVRAFLATEAGELLVGAREGLFRADPSGTEIERLSSEPVRSLALLPAGEVAAGGESGLLLVPPGAGAGRRVPTPDPWVESVGFDGRRLWAATAQGVVSGPLDGDGPSLVPHPRGSDVTRGVLWGGRWLALSGGNLVSLGADGSRSEDPLPHPFDLLLQADRLLLADGPEGTFRRTEDGWTLVARRAEGSLPLPRVNALASEDRRIWIGFFDGGLAEARLREGGAGLGPVRSVGGSSAWGVNALLPAGGELWVASLRGAFRLRGADLSPLEGAGAAFSLAATGGGVAVGYGNGVALPGPRLLSAFHGLPGNQSIALAPDRRGEALWVGTPTGLGRVERRRVTARVTAGEGKLPHPWVTGLALAGDGLLVATYGGGVAVRRGEGRTETWNAFPETAGLKVNAACLLVDPSGRAWVGTQGKGLWRSDPARTRFARVDVALPSPNVFALALHPGGDPRSLLVGTDEGLASLPLPDSATAESP